MVNSALRKLLLGPFCCLGRDLIFRGIRDRINPPLWLPFLRGLTAFFRTEPKMIHSNKVFFRLRFQIFHVN